MSDYLVKRLREGGGITCLSAANRIKEMEAKLAKAVEALEPYAQLAKHHAADAPEWGPFDSVTAQVSVMNLRDALTIIEELEGGDE